MKTESVNASLQFERESRLSVEEQLSSQQARNTELEEELAQHKKQLEAQESRLQELSSANAKLSGHSNTRQKIQHTLKIKQENEALRQVTAVTLLCNMRCVLPIFEVRHLFTSS